MTWIVAALLGSAILLTASASAAVVFDAQSARARTLDQSFV